LIIYTKPNRNFVESEYQNNHLLKGPRSNKGPSSHFAKKLSVVIGRATGMKICKVWDSEYPWDVRVEKIASTLTAAGHEVHIVARNRSRMPLIERLPEGTVHRLTPLPSLGRRLSHASMFPAFFNPRWIQAVYDVVRNVCADLILVRDLPLAPAAVWVGRLLGRPVMLDMAENYPAMMRSLWSDGVQQPFDWIVRNPVAVQWVERWVLRKANHFLVVVQESMERLVSLGVSPERITIVCNTPPVARLTSSLDRKRLTGESTIEVIYLGILEASRGLGVLIDAIARCRRNGLPVALTVIGEGRERGVFEEQARQAGVGPDVIRFKGYIPYHEAVKHLQAADIGVVPHMANDSWNTTIPNKLFDYMASGIAVITSDAKPAARIVRTTGAGEVYRYNDPEDLAGALSRMGTDVQYRDKCGAAGREAIRATYQWEKDARRLLGAIEGVVSRNFMGAYPLV
jgi:glycosyltransferase involved in cell wall biosynthesis